MRYKWDTAGDIHWTRYPGICSDKEVHTDSSVILSICDYSLRVFNLYFFSILNDYHYKQLNESTYKLCMPKSMSIKRIWMTVFPPCIDNINLITVINQSYHSKRSRSSLLFFGSLIVNISKGRSFKLFRLSCLNWKRLACLPYWNSAVYVPLRVTFKMWLDKSIKCFAGRNVVPGLQRWILLIQCSATVSWKQARREL